MANYFFKSSRDAASQITDLFVFVWPTAAALWNLRWQVKGFIDEVPAATVKELHDRFIFGSSLSGTDLRKACVSTTWDEQKERFASIILTNAFSIYESWADELLMSLHSSFDGKRFQFPDSGTAKKDGMESGIAELCTSISPTLEAAYFPVFCASEKYARPLLKNLLLAYRYFKEIRNCEMHAGAIASTKTEQAYKNFHPYSDKKSLGMRGDLVIDPIVKGSRIRLHLRGVVGFCDILLRIITTVDAELMRSSRAEPHLKSRFLDTGPRPKELAGDRSRRNKQIIHRCNLAGLPRPADVDAMYDFLRSERIIYI